MGENPLPDKKQTKLHYVLHWLATVIWFPNLQLVGRSLKDTNGKSPQDIQTQVIFTGQHFM